MCLTSCYFLLGGIVKCISYTRTCQQMCLDGLLLFVILFQSVMWNKCVSIVCYLEHGKQMFPDCLLAYIIISNIILCVWYHVISFWEVSSNAYPTLEHVKQMCLDYPTLAHVKQISLDGLLCQRDVSWLFFILHYPI